MATITNTPAVNDAIKAANDLPMLITGLNALDPALAQQIEGKSLLASKSVYGPFIVSGIVYLSGRYGLTWDHDICVYVAGGVVLLASAAFRLVTTGPITGLFKKKAVAAPAAAPAV